MPTPAVALLTGIDDIGSAADDAGIEARLSTMIIAVTICQNALRLKTLQVEVLVGCNVGEDAVQLR